MTHAVAQATTQTPRAQALRLDFDDLQSRRLDCLIAKLRTGQINNVVMRHLEVDGVLQLDPLFELAKCDDEPVR